MNSDLISVIIPTYNRKNLIGTTIESVIKQTYKKWECIIVDDGSNDGTEEFIKKCYSVDTRIKFFRRPANKSKGANACRNFGFKKSRGQLILFLDSDDMLDLDCLRRRTEMMENNPELDFAVFSMGIFTDENNPMVDSQRKLFYLKNNEEYINQFLEGSLPWNMTRPIYRRSFFKKTHGFDEELQLFQDDEFHIRILADMDPRFQIIDETDCYYRIGAHQEKKYSDNKFKVKFTEQYFLFQVKLLNLFREKFTYEIKKTLVRGFIKIISNYSFSFTQFKKLSKLLNQYQRHKVITIKQHCALWIILVINTFYKDRKGYFLLKKKLIEKALI